MDSFEDGYEFDAVVLDDSVLPHPQPLTVHERLERAFYLGLDRNGIRAKFVRGEMSEFLPQGSDCQLWPAITAPA